MKKIVILSVVIASFLVLASIVDAHGSMGYRNIQNFHVEQQHESMHWMMKDMHRNNRIGMMGNDIHTRCQ